MNCSQIDNLLDAYIDGDLSPALLNAVSQHHQSCSSCADSYHKAIKLRSLLKVTPVPPLSEGFADRAFKKVTQSSDRKKRISFATYSGAIAAGLAIWLISADLIFPTSNNTNSGVNDIYVELTKTGVKTINVAIESEHDLNSVQLSIQLTPNLELAGFGNRTSINWDTRLKQGTNVIKLPIVGLAAGEGEIITRIQMNGKEKVMHIKTKYQTPDNVRYQINSATHA